ncbi:MAG: hypothetical protein HC888_01305 [Candidatus Competibacteraceae bacterium]|nr:hypothetical protein [Candidatus Competibacteraceae bacterium]
MAGCFRWYWEESEPRDSNAAFFIGLALLVLHHGYAGQLSEPSRRQMQEMFAGLQPWFMKEALGADPVYPNKYLGDLTCAWLLSELHGPSSPEPLIHAMEKAARYWLDQHWGWGEHMSDIYTTVMLDQLSALLLFSKRLPPHLHDLYSSMFAELLAIEDTFQGGPRVPQIRSYAFEESPTHRHYRQRIRSWTSNPEIAEEKSNGWTSGLGSWMSHLAFEKGWHQLAPAPVPPLPQIPCLGGQHAMFEIHPDIRLGGMTRYPIMSGIDHATWGLSWQTFPVAFWRAEGDWGFWRWISQEAGVLRAHPALQKHSAYLKNALTDALNPPVVGETYSHLDQGKMLILRRIDPRGCPWELCRDAFQLLQNHAQIERTGERCLQLRYPERTLHISQIPLGPDLRLPQLEQNGQTLSWSLDYTRTELAESKTPLLHLWALSLNPEDTPPQATLQDDQVQIQWGNLHTTLRPTSLP